MTKRELRRFRMAAGRAGRKAYRNEVISSEELDAFRTAMLDDAEVERMAAVCSAQAVASGLMTSDQAASGDVKWVGLGENIDWKCLGEFIIKIIPMFI